MEQKDSRTTESLRPVDILPDALQLFLASAIRLAVSFVSLKMFLVHWIGCGLWPLQSSETLVVPSR